MGNGTVVGKLSLDLGVNGQGLRSQINSLTAGAQRDLNTFSRKSSNDMTSAFTGAAKKIGVALAAAFSVKALIGFTKQCVEVGSNLTEVQNVVDTAFKSMSSQVDSFAKNAMYNFGMSEKVAKQYMGTIGAMNNAFGFAEKQSYDMATAITGLTGDVASFYNLDADEAFNKLKAIWTGETESLKTLGVVMTQTALDQYALNNGFGKTTAKMTEQEKVMLRFQFVQSSLADASGDFVKTQDSWANQTRILTLRMESLKATLGQGFINLFTPIIKSINTLLAKLAVLAESFQKFTENLMGVSSETKNLGNVANMAMEASGGMSELTSSAKAAKRELAGFDKITKLSDLSSEGGNSTTGGGTSKPGGVSGNDAEKTSNNVMKMLDDLKDRLNLFKNWATVNFGDGISGIWNGLITNTKTMVKTISKCFKDIKSLGKPLTAYFNGPFVRLINSSLKLIETRLNGAYGTFNRVFSDIWNVAAFPMLKKFITTGLPVFTEFATKSNEIMAQFYQEMYEIYNMLWSDAAVPALAMISQCWSDLMDDISSGWNEWGQPVFDGLSAALTTTQELFTRTWNGVLKPLFDNMINNLDKLWNEHMRPYVKNLMDFAGAFITCATTIYDNFIRPVVGWIVEVLGPVFVDKFKMIQNLAFSSIGNVIDQFNFFITVGTSVLKFLTDVFKGDWSAAWNDIKNIAKTVWDGLVDIVKNPINICIGLINDFAAACVTAFNAVIKAINKISIDIPDWVPEFGGKKFGMNLQLAKTPDEIPMLAEGAYVKANTPQLAMIGDNRHQGEFVAPEDKLRKMAMDAIKASQNSDSTCMYEILKTLKLILEVLKALNLDIVIDGKKLKDIIVDEINKNTKNTGVCEIII